MVAGVGYQTYDIEESLISSLLEFHQPVCRPLHTDSDCHTGTLHPGRTGHMCRNRRMDQDQCSRGMVQMDLTKPKQTNFQHIWV